MNSASAVDLDSFTVLSFTFDTVDLSGSTVFDKSSNGFNASIFNTINTGQVGVINQGFAKPNVGTGSGTQSFVRSNFTGQVAGLNDYTVSMWINYTHTYTNLGYWLFTLSDGSVNNDIKLGVFTGTSSYSNLVLRTQNSGGISDTSSLNVGSVSGYNHYVFVINESGTRLSVWKNGVLQASQTVTARSNNAVNRFTISGNNAVEGTFGDRFQWDEVAVFNKSLTQTEIEFLYNSGDGRQFPYDTTSTNFSVAVTDSWSGGAVNNVTLTLPNSTTYSNTTGNIIYTDIPSNTTSLLNYTLSSPEYFSRSFVGVNVSSSASNSLAQNFYVFEAEEVFTSNKLPYVMVTPTDLNSSSRVKEYYFQANSSTLATIVRTPTLGSPLIYNLTIPASCFSTNGFLNLTFVDDLNSEFYATCNNFYGEQQVLYNATGEDINNLDSNGEFFFQNINVTINSQQQVMFPLSNGLFNASFLAQNYFLATNTINATTLSNETLTLVEIGSAKLNITAKDGINNATITTFSGTITNNELGVTTSFSSNNNFSEVLLLTGYNYTLNLDPVSGYSTNTGLQQNISINDTNTNLTFVLYQNNSILFNIYGTDLNPFNSEINITLQNNNITYNFNTSNGELFVSGLQQGTYFLTTSTANFSSVQQIVSLNNGEFITVDIYLSTNLLPKIFNVVDNIGNVVPDATISFFYFINGTLITHASAKTDFSGQTILLLNEDTLYSFTVTKEGYNTFSGEVKPTNNEYTINIELIGATIFISPMTDISYRVNLSKLNNLTYVLANYELASVSGSIQYFGMSTQYLNTDYSINNTGNPSGGVLNLNITNINVSAQNTITITYWFKSVDYPLQEWNITYYLDSDAEQRTNLRTIRETTRTISNEAKLLIGMFILLIFITIGVSFAGLIGGQIMGAIGVGINAYLTFFPVLGSVVAITIIIILLIVQEVSK